MFPIEFDSDRGHDAISRGKDSNSENPMPGLASPKRPSTPEFNGLHVPSPHSINAPTVDPKNLESHGSPAASTLTIKVMVLHRQLPLIAIKVMMLHHRLPLIAIKVMHDQPPICLRLLKIIRDHAHLAVGPGSYASSFLSESLNV